MTGELGVASEAVDRPISASSFAAVICGAAG
jgi:hypothetical protein